MDYLTIWLRIIKEFKISANDALVLEFIYKTSTFPESKYPGWCYASKIYIADLMNISMRTLYYIFNTLEEKKLIERDNQTGFLRTTKLYNDVHFLSQNKDEEIALGVQKLQSGTAKIAVDGLQKLHTINKEDNKKKNIYIDFLEIFNSESGKKIRVLDDKSKRQLNARFKEGYTIEEIRAAISNCSKDPFHIENPKYLTPEFITRPDKLARYLNAAPEKQSQPIVRRGNHEYQR